MRTLKKSLALVLVIALVLSFGVVGASAAFTDTADSDYGTAIQVLTGIKVIDGMTDTTFEPTSNLTREQAAKIITYMLLGPTNATLVTGVTSQKFADVATDRWSAGYIEYCANLGIISGVGDNNFDPAGTLTTCAWTKMLLCALGYKASAEGLEGDSWAINTAALAVTAGISDSSILLSASAACSREAACQLAYKTLTANTVQYTGGSEMTVGGVTVTVGATRSYVQYTTPSSTAVMYNGNDDGYVQFCENHFPKLLRDATPSNGVSGYTWYLDGTKISGFIADAKVLGTVTDGTKISVVTDPTKSAYIASLATDADLATAGTQPVAYYFNGAPVAEYSTSATYSSGDKVVYGNILYVANASVSADTWANNLSKFDEYTVTGAVVTLYGGTSSNANKVVKVGVVQQAVAVLSSDAVVKTTGSVTKVTIPNTGITSQLSANVTYPDGLVKGDVVLYYQAGTHYYVEKAESVTGTMGGFSAISVTVDGTKYGISELVGNNSGTFLATGYLGLAGVTFYFDDGGNVVYAVSPTSVTTLSNYLFVKQAAMSGFNAIASIVLTDGTTKTVTVAKVNGADPDTSSSTVATTDDLTATTFYSFTVDSDGNYLLTSTTHQAAYVTDVSHGTTTTGNTDSAIDNASDHTYKITKNTVQFLTDKTYTTSVVANPVTSVIGTAKTVFLYQGTSSVTAYTGINGTASYGYFGNIYVLTDGATPATALAVYATGSTAGSTTNASELVMILGNAPTTNYVSAGKYTYSYPAIKNGDVTTVTFGAMLTTPAGQIYEITGYTGDVVTSYNANVTTGLVAYDSTVADTALVANADGATLQVDGVYYVLNSAVRYFTINTATGTATELTAYDVNNLASGSYAVTTVETSSTDASISYVFIR